ncbi:MAG: Bax inhibitor-1 family protein [Planctomycetaceae bacterium]|nr:Bax inhibitor-1 family protein [Planctomycetaceae bacterium]
MSYDSQNPYQVSYSGFAGPAILAEEDARAAFIRRTYLHLAGAIAAFVAIEAAIFTLVPMAALDSMMQTLFAARWGWLVVLAGFIGVSWLAQTWASSETSQSVQYLGLSLYVVAESIIFVPLLYIASAFAPGAIPAAGILTLVMFGGLTALVFITRSDLTSWGKYLWCAGFAALGVVIASVIFGFDLGVWFSGVMIALASAYILYDTSNVLHRYRTEQYVAAALALFASVALLFWYILRLMMELNRR